MIVTVKYRGGFVGGPLTPELVSVYEVVVVCPSTTSTSLMVFVREHVTVSVLEKVQPSWKFLYIVLVDVAEENQDKGLDVNSFLLGGARCDEDLGEKHSRGALGNGNMIAPYTSGHCKGKCNRAGSSAGNIIGCCC